jgi:hypothetical protein
MFLDALKDFQRLSRSEDAGYAAPRFLKLGIHFGGFDQPQGNSCGTIWQTPELIFTNRKCTPDGGFGT